ncbi:MAG: 50S ribosomal protein L11 methyltransferase [Eubacterium sp.]|nr:50S ribosomal protein L11 methyltransferase [Eubacterium sp.]
MTNAIEQERWHEIQLEIPCEYSDEASDIANMVVPYGIYIEDYSALEEETMEIAHIDLIDEELLKKDRTKSIIHIYINPDENPLEAVSFLKERLDRAGIENRIKTENCRLEDWQNNWKNYFHPTPVGKKLLIRPVWENDFDAGDRKVLNIEPGLAFGTGSHPTTKLCLETLEEYIKEDSTVLDIGCGSGILSIAALLLGAESALGIDIDELAVKTANENAAQNGFDNTKFKALQGDLSDKVSGKYSVIVANIVADIIIRFNKEVKSYLEEGGVYITGGIIESREGDVLLSFAENGFEIIERRENNGWLVFVLKAK